VVLSLLLIWAATAKLRDMPAFARSVAGFKLLPARLVPLTSKAVVVTELTVAIALVTPWLRKGSLVVLTGLLAVFTAALVSAAARGLDIRCGCFGTRGTGTTLPILRNLALLAAAGLLLFAEDWRAGHTPKPTADLANKSG
jgi:hypothetical protein